MSGRSVVVALARPSLPKLSLSLSPLVPSAVFHAAAYIEDLLATHIVDWGIGDAFFGRGDRMHEDALSEGTARYLDILFPSGASDDDDNDDE